MLMYIKIHIVNNISFLLLDYEKILYINLRNSTSLAQVIFKIHSNSFTERLKILLLWKQCPEVVPVAGGVMRQQKRPVSSPPTSVQHLLLLQQRLGERSTPRRS